MIDNCSGRNVRFGSADGLDYRLDLDVYTRLYLRFVTCQFTTQLELILYLYGYCTAFQPATYTSGVFLEQRSELSQASLGEVGGHVCRYRDSCCVRRYGHMIYLAANESRVISLQRPIPRESRERDKGRSWLAEVRESILFTFICNWYFYYGAN